MEEKQAERKLQDLYMKGSEINKYICDFKDLIRKAWRIHNDKVTVQLFQQGLNQKLHRAIWEQIHPRPETLDQWITGAREQQNAWLNFNTVFGRYLQEWNKQKGNFKEQYQQRQNQQHNDAMDVDTIQVNALTLDECANYMKEGRCFFCKDKGHMSKACPKKQKNKQKSQQTRTVEVKATKEEEPQEEENDKAKILSRVGKLSKEDRMAIFDEMLKVEGF